MSVFSPAQIKEQLHGLKPKKSLGQNFLISLEILDSIIKAAEPGSGDTVLEIGPGLGQLTFELAKRVKKVIAVERDKKLTELLRRNIEIKKLRKRVEVVNEDILKFTGRWPLAAGHKIVANLPYEITSPVLWRFLHEEANKPQLMVLMVQREVAEKIVARPGNMSLLSVLCQFYAKPEIVCKVSRGCFWPQPKVDSAVIKFIVGAGLKPAPAREAVFDTKGFFQFVKRGFANPRKKLVNNLEGCKALKKQEIESIFKDLKLDQGLRVAHLSVKAWIDIFTNL